MSIDEFKAYETTFYLLFSKNNADRLNAATEELGNGGSIEQELYRRIAVQLAVKAIACNTIK